MDVVIMEIFYGFIIPVFGIPAAIGLFVAILVYKFYYKTKYSNRNGCAWMMTIIVFSIVTLVFIILSFAQWYRP